MPRGVFSFLQIFSKIFEKGIPFSCKVWYYKKSIAGVNMGKTTAYENLISVLNPHKEADKAWFLELLDVSLRHSCLLVRRCLP